MSIHSGFLLRKVNVFTQIQDLGRFGGASLGLTQGGVIDVTSARLANALVDNEPDTPLLEIGLGMIRLEAIGDLSVAMTGAKMPMFVNGHEVCRYQHIHLKHGDQLDIGYSKAGVRCYLAVAGGFVATPILGSCATVLREKVGGIDGLPLHNEQVIPVLTSQKSFKPRSVAYEFHFKAKAMQQIPFVIGAQQLELGETLLRRFESNIYQVTPMSDRMGMRLQGSVLPVTSQTLISEGISLGAIQIPADGQPIVMLNDHQTIGGYPKIGAVTRLGVEALGQCRPGHLLQFVQVSVVEAVEQARQHERWLRTLEQQIRNC